MHSISAIFLISIALNGSPAISAPLDSLLNVQRARGDFVSQLFKPIEHPEQSPLTADELADYDFLLANLPLGDLATMSAADLVENVCLARTASDRFVWGKEIPADIYRYFVLPHRTAKEPFSHWRGRFLQELAPRLEGLSMAEAVLEVNHWCHANATYRPTDGRDQDPLTTIRGGFGRCTEETILAVAALRSVGIPARKCYTPYWAHCDDRHAWVEVWVDGRWFYFGACEPAPSLNQAWFSNTAQRAMLVVSKVYGDYQGSESVLYRYGRSTWVNSTAVYGPTRTVKVQVVDHKGKPVSGQKIIFNLFNEGAWKPALALTANEQGWVEVVCGMGDWLVSTGKEKLAAIAYAPMRADAVTLRLEKLEYLDELAVPSDLSLMAQRGVVDYRPPPQPKVETSLAGLYSAEGEARGVIDPTVKLLADSMFRCRMQEEDSTRESAVWSTWATEQGIPMPSLKPDSLRLSPFMAAMKEIGLDAGEVLQLFDKARGNWGTLYQFITGVAPFAVAADGSPQFTPLPDDFLIPPLLKNKLRLLKALSDKDLRDFALSTLTDHYENTTLTLALSELMEEVHIDSLDSLAAQRYMDYVVAPRIDYEPSLPWRKELVAFFGSQPKLINSKRDKELIKWLRKNITVEENPDQLGAPLTPAQTIGLMRGSRGDVARLYVGLCRMRGIPARFNPISRRLERWEDGDWHGVILFKNKGESSGGKQGKLSIAATVGDSLTANALYQKEWCLARWESDHFEAVDLGWHKPFKEITFPVELPAGRYCLTSGRRRADGSAKVNMEWTELKEGKEDKVILRFEE